MTNVLLVTSNGTGMGHLTRQAAIALSMGAEHKPTIFSLSVGLPQVVGLGVAGEYGPSYDRPWIAGREWHGYLRDRLLAIIEETGAEALLFDGVAVYPGIAMASATARDVAFAWLRRGMWQERTNTGQLRRAGHFDLVIQPGDMAGEDSGPTSRSRDVRHVSPISMLEVIGLKSREEARADLGLPAEGEIALVTLGSGMLGDVAGPGRVAIETILEESDLSVAVTSPAVALNRIDVEGGGRIHEITGVYPLARYLGAFDLAVSSAGYNAVHELVPAGVPTLFVANTSTRTDDQAARARGIEVAGLGLQGFDDQPSGVVEGVRRLLRTNLRDEIGAMAAATRDVFHGAAETGDLVVELAADFNGRKRKPSAAVADTVARAKEALKDTLGEERTERLKRVLGREASPTGQRATVRVTDRPSAPEAGQPLPLALVTELTGDDLGAGVPIEHLLAGSSERYRTRRMEIIDTYYDVVG